MGRIAGKIEDLDYIRLICNAGCGKIRRDVQRNLNHPATKSLMKRFNVDNPQKLQEVWICKDCRKKEKTSKKGQVSSKNPTLNIETSENIKIDESMNYLIPQMESEYISRKIRGKNDLNVLSEAFEFNVANYNNKNTELHNPLLIGETGSGKCIFFNNKSDFVVMADGRLLKIKNILQNDKILNLDETNLKLKSSLVYGTIPTQSKELVKVVTNYGKQIKVTPDHPFFTIDGWKDSSKLKIGDYIAVVRKYYINSNKTLNQSYIKILAY